MPHIVVLGAGLNGLSTAMLMAADGHTVTVLERDPAEPPAAVDDAWETWERRGVTQFRLPHFMLPRWRAVMERELPEVIAALEAWGGLRLNMLTELPHALTGGLADGEVDRGTVTARRPVLEAALSSVAAGRVDIRRGVAVAGVVTGRSVVDSVPHVVGVRTDTGEEVGADLVVDTTGRRSPLPRWIVAAGGREPAERHEDSGFVYYARHFRADPGTRPAVLAGLLQDYESVSILTLPADNDTWSVAFIASSRDQELRALRDPERWADALALYPCAAHWRDGEPITAGVDTISKIEDRMRRFVVDGLPVATGVVAVGDSWACTNPSLGRGSSIGLLHACSLRDLLREIGPDEPEKLVRRWDDVTSAVVAPLYRMTVAYDRHRLAEIEAECAGRSYQTPDPAWAMTKALRLALLHDPEVLRGYLDIIGLIATPDEVLARPRMFERVVELGANAPAHTLPGAPRTELVAALQR
jgi:2-polyprenyl-6-methoxyphenol hydroxylase-like FAD-dependent oxidoreductase